MKFVILLILATAVVSEIIDEHTNVDSPRFGIAQEHAHPKCKKRAHTASFAPPVRNDGDYDFIVVGGGSAGNVIAARLADSSPDIKVLLLESGKNPIDDAGDMAETLQNLMKMDYCSPGQTADKCSLLSLPLHLSETPFMNCYLSLSNHSYYYQTTPQLYANKREINYPRGNLMGGSSATNNMVAIRGHPRDFDKWASLGLEGWSYNDLLPFMKRIETNHQYGDHEAHGTTGPVHLFNSSGFFNFPVLDNLLKTAQTKLGYKKVEDFNKGYDDYGAGYWQQYSNDKGRRTSSYEYIRRMMKHNRVCIDGFIATANQDKDGLKIPENSNDKTKNNRKPCTSEQNLIIKTQTLVTKLLFEESTRHEGMNSKSTTKPRVIGVEYTDHSKHPYNAVRRPKDYTKYKNEEEKSRAGMDYWKTAQRHEVLNCPVAEELAFDNSRMNEWFIPPFNGTNKADMTEVFAKREVILSSGTYNSPQLLMLSGIGNRKHLENQLGFKEEELVMDLPGVGSRLLDHEEMTVNFQLPKGVQHWGILKDLLTETNKWHDGKSSSLSSNHIPGGMDISSDGPNGTIPTIHIHFIMLHVENIDATMWRKNGADVRLPMGLTDFARYEGLNRWSALIERTGSCSEGSVRLKNRDPFVTPLINPNYGSCEFSNKEILYGIKEVRKLNEMLPKEFRSTEVLPGPEYDTDEKLINYIRNALWGHHASGTNPMGRCEDEDAVLDSHGRVFGVEGIRVADASVFPTIPHGNILYSTYTVAERISEFIVKDHKIDDGKPSLIQAA